jgi:hypothetical protein
MKSPVNDIEPTLFPDDILTISEEITDQDEVETFELEEDILILDSDSPISENQHYVIQEPSVPDNVSEPPDDGQKFLLEFGFGEDPDDANEPTINQIPKSVSFQTFLGDPYSEDPLASNIGKKKLRKPGTFPDLPSARKVKGTSIFGVEELMNLISSTKYTDFKQVEKKNGKVNGKVSSYADKTNDIEILNQTNRSGKNECFINNSISQLPVDDYLSLFK